MNDIFDKINDLIRRSENILLTSHRDPDGDSIGSMLAMYNYLVSLDKEVILLSNGVIPEKYGFLPGINNINDINDYRGGQKIDLAIFLECPTIDRAGGSENIIERTTKIINIDHHPDNSGYGDIAYLNNEASSVGEILTEYFLSRNYNIDKHTATVLYAAILTDTGRFRFDATRPRTMDLAGKLIEFGARPREITDNIYYSFSTETLKLTGRLLAGMELFEDGRICLISLAHDSANGKKFSPADTEGMAEFTLYDRKVLVGGFLREGNGNCIKISLRSREKYDVSSLAHKYGGGGHFNASGYTIKAPLESAKGKLLSDLRELIGAAI